MSSTISPIANTRSTPKTPIRAITSTIASRSSPSIPPSTQTYEPLVKHVLRQRLTYNVFLCSAVVTWSLNTVWMIWQNGGFGELGLGVLAAPFQPLTISSSLLSWLITALPVVVVRKILLTGERSPATSPSMLFHNAYSKSSMRRANYAYLFSSILFTCLHTALVYASRSGINSNEDPKLFLFVKSRKHPFYLNGRLLFLILTQATVAFAFSLRNVLLERSVFRWPTNSMETSNRKGFGAYQAIKCIAVSLLLATATVVTSALLFALVRITLPLWYKLPLLHMVLRPFTAHFLKGSWTVFLPIRHFQLVVRAWFLAFTTLIIWESSEIYFEHFICQHITVSHSTTNPNLTLVSGVTSSDVIFKYFAYCELANCATGESQSSSAQRSALFGDQKNSLNLWSRFLRESLILLGKDYQLFLRRGKPQPPTPAPVAPAKPPPSDTIPATPIPLLRQRIFQRMTEGPVDFALQTLGSDGPISKVIESGVESANIPDLFRSVETTVVSKPVKEEIKKTVEQTKGVLATYNEKIVVQILAKADQHFPQAVKKMVATCKDWWKQERLSRVVEMSLPSRELDVAVIDVISHLTSASLTEDKFGVVQRDIPKILEAMLSFLAAIEEYHMEINKLNPTPPIDPENDTEENKRMRLEVERASEILGVVGDSLKEGVARIVRTFGDKLLAFKFPPRTAQKLQGFMDYC